MYDISTLDEARDVLAKKEFFADDARKVLLYLIERETEYRKGFATVQAALVGTMEAMLAVLLGFTKVAIPDLDIRQKLNEATESLNEARDLLKADSLVN